MSIRSSKPILALGSLLLAACSGSSESIPSETQYLTHSEEAAKRLHASFLNLKLPPLPEASNRSGIEVRKLLCILSNNGPLAGPMHLVPTTECTFESAVAPDRREFASRKVTDQPQKAKALVDAADELPTAEMALDQGSHVVQFESIQCSRREEESGTRCTLRSKPFGARPGQTTKIEMNDLTNEPKAARMLRAFELAGVTKFVDGVRIAEVKEFTCRQPGSMAEATFEGTRCTFQSELGQHEIKDDSPRAYQLLRALEGMGLRGEHVSGGKFGVSTASVKCSTGPQGQETSCVVDGAGAPTWAPNPSPASPNFGW